MAEPTCICRTLTGPEGPYIAQEKDCPVHKPQAPRCSDMSSEEFAAYVGKSVTTVCRWAKKGHPAARWCEFRKEWRWLPEAYKKALDKNMTKPGAVQTAKRKQPGPRPKYAVLSGGGR